MLTRVLSFGFKYGVPTDADMLLDVRFLCRRDRRVLTGWHRHTHPEGAFTQHFEEQSAR